MFRKLSGRLSADWSPSNNRWISGKFLVIIFTMPRDVDVMRVALRVLAAAAEFRNPNPDDTAKLRRLAPDLNAALPIEDVACIVVRRTLQEFRLRHQKVLSLKRSA